MRTKILATVALACFWTAAWGAYSLTRGAWLPNLFVLSPTYEYFFPFHESGDPAQREGLWVLWLAIGCSMSLLPIAFLSLAAHDSLFKWRDKRILCSGFLFAVSIAFAASLVDHDAVACIVPLLDEGYSYPTVTIPAREQFRVSWLGLFAPIVITSAVVVALCSPWGRDIQKVSATHDFDHKREDNNLG